MDEEQRGMNDTSGCMIPVVLFGIVLFAGIYWYLQYNPVKQDANDPVKVVHESEWKSLQEELALLRSEVNSLKKSNPSSKAITLYRFKQKFNSTEATLTLRNNTNRTITHITGEIYYYSLSGRVLAHKTIDKDVNLTPGMAIGVPWTGCRLKDGFIYYKNAPANADHNKLYKVQLKLSDYKVR